MRLPCLFACAWMLLPVASAYAQPCSGYPADKTWQADGGAPAGTQLIQDANGGYPGWKLEQLVEGGTVTQNHPATVDAETAQQNELERSNPNEHGLDGIESFYTTEGTTWSIAGGNELSFTWHVYISNPGNTAIAGQTSYFQPALNDRLQIELRNGVGRLKLSYEENVTDADGCLASGWLISNAETISGGRPIPGRIDNAISPAERYLPMPMAEWHTIRVDIHADGTFDVWLDGGGSDWKHVSGTTESAGSTYIRFGLIDDSRLSYEFSTACVAWGEGAGEIPAVPSVTEEICDNEDVDDDGDANADCADSDCDCLAFGSECERLMERIETFNNDFVTPPGAPNPAEFFAPPGWLYFGDTNLVRAAQETGAFWLPPTSGTVGIASQQLRLPMDFLGSDLDGTFGLELEAAAQELTSLPIDWSFPVSVAMDSNGSDLTTDGQWESFVTFDGYTGTGGPDISQTEWGNNGRPQLGTGAGFVPHVWTLDPGQAAVTDARLRFGINFDFNPPAFIPVNKTDISFFENVRIIYTPDFSLPLLLLSETAFSRTAQVGETLAVDVFSVSNLLGGSMNYTVTDDADWLSVAPGAGGPLAGGESDVVTVSYDTASMVGEYTATITVSSLEAWKSPETIDVTLIVELAPPDYDVDGDVDQLDFSVQQSCLTGAGMGPPSPGVCADYADLNGDLSVDELDMDIFEDCASGPGIPFDPACVP